MSDVNETNPQEQQTLYTQTQVEQLLREFSKRMEFDKQSVDENIETEFPMETLNQLKNTSSQQLQENFRKFKREGNKYAQNKWTTGQFINKELLPELKRYQMDTTQVVNSIYKITDNTRFQATTAVELYEQIEYLKNHHHKIEPEEAFSILQRTSEQAKRLADFGLATAKTQEQEAKEYAIKTLRLLPSLKHLESQSEFSKRANMFDSEFIEQLHQARFEQRLSQGATRGRGNSFTPRGFRGNNRGGFRGSYGRGSFFGGRGRGGNPNGQFRDNKVQCHDNFNNEANQQ